MDDRFKLKPFKEWQEKEGKRVLKSMRLYVGQLHVATVYPKSNAEPHLYGCTTFFDCIATDCEYKPLEEIKTEIELSLKEFINKLVAPRRLKPVHEGSTIVMQASPSKRFSSTLKRDGKGKR